MSLHLEPRYLGNRTAKGWVLSRHVGRERTGKWFIPKVGDGFGQVKRMSDGDFEPETDETTLQSVLWAARKLAAERP